MRCIFCKANTAACSSAEHIIPESLGNVEHILPVGWVCDTCNNYFAREVEKPFLNALYGRSSRFMMRVPSKKRRIPSAIGFHPQSRTRVELFYSTEDGLSVGAAEGEDVSRWVDSFETNTRGAFYIPAPDIPAANMETSRFIGKVAMEVLAYHTLEIPVANDEIVDKAELNQLRQYVRVGVPRIVWPVNIRRIYSQDKVFADVRYGSHQMLHEFDMLLTPEGEYYCVVAIFGVEYCINLGGPELDGYYKWLKDNNDRSPLYLTEPPG
jgi:hypothetical protein